MFAIPSRERTYALRLSTLFVVSHAHQKREGEREREEEEEENVERREVARPAIFFSPLLVHTRETMIVELCHRRANVRNRNEFNLGRHHSPRRSLSCRSNSMKQ